MPLKCHENILIFYEHLPTYNPQFTYGKPYYKTNRKASTNYRLGIDNTSTDCKDGKRYPRDIFHFSAPKKLWGRDAEKCDHPTQKPVALCEYLIKTYTNEGETVLDNCMGSGTTGVACVNTGRNFIGMELDEYYFEIASKRIAEAENGRR